MNAISGRGHALIQIKIYYYRLNKALSSITSSEHWLVYVTARQEELELG